VTGDALRELLHAWSKAVEARDLEALMDLWTDDAVFAGASEEELQVGPQIREWFGTVLATDHTVEMTWQEPILRTERDLAWFLVEATVTIDGTKPRPYRISGVLRREAGVWRFAMWNGAEPH
jgi:ketosteroid isomerase-like protein